MVAYRLAKPTQCRSTILSCHVSQSQSVAVGFVCNMIFISERQRVSFNSNNLSLYAVTSLLASVVALQLGGHLPEGTGHF